MLDARRGILAYSSEGRFAHGVERGFRLPSMCNFFRQGRSLIEADDKVTVAFRATKSASFGIG